MVMVPEQSVLGHVTSQSIRSAIGHSGQKLFGFLSPIKILTLIFISKFYTVIMCTNGTLSTQYMHPVWYPEHNTMYEHSVYQFYTWNLRCITREVFL